MKPLAIYIHWPFCVSKCPYCDFASRPMGASFDEKEWLGAYRKEIAFYAQKLPKRPLSSIYFGGGTPSLMSPAMVEVLLDTVREHWPLLDDCEITLEANPSSSAIDKFKAFRTAGVNRLSLGIQAFDDEVLQFLGRAHDGATACKAIEMAAQVFDRFSFDLMYAYAGQAPDQWAASLRQALAFAPRHLSLYQLTIEPRTPFAKRSCKETLCVGEEEAAFLYEQTQEILGEAGLPAYEISNHAVEGQESRHNLTYWHYEEYIGVGPAAHGRFMAEGERWATANHEKPDLWLRQVNEKQQGQETLCTLSSGEAQQEALLMGLRLASGIDKKDWKEKFGTDLSQFLSLQRVHALVEERFVENTSSRFYVTALGRAKLNAILAYLVE